MDYIGVVILSYLVYVVFDILFLKPRHERAVFRERVYGFASCVASSDAGGGIYLGDFMDLVDTNISRVEKPQSPDDPLYGKSAPEYAVLLLSFYAEQEGLHRLRSYCSELLHGVEHLRVYGSSRSLV